MLHHVGQFCRVRFWICLVFPVRENKMGLQLGVSQHQHTQMRLSVHGSTSFPGAVCGCPASSSRQLDKSIVWSGRLWWEPQGQQKPTLSRLNLLLLVESSLLWCNLQNWTKKKTPRSENISFPFLCLQGIDVEESMYYVDTFHCFSKAKILVWKQQVADPQPTRCCMVIHVIIH